MERFWYIFDNYFAPVAIVAAGVVYVYLMFFY